jgi:hypothetical protein
VSSFTITDTVEPFLTVLLVDEKLMEALPAAPPLPMSDTPTKLNATNRRAINLFGFLVDFFIIYPSFVILA